LLAWFFGGDLCQARKWIFLKEATLAHDPHGEFWSEDDRGPRHSKSPWNGIPRTLA
jgi:hypothetical protein